MARLTLFWEHISHPQCQHWAKLSLAHSDCLLIYSLESPSLLRGTQDPLGPSCKGLVYRDPIGTQWPQEAPNQARG